jgi:hypothetical protein
VREAVCDCSLTDARRTDEDRVVGATASEDVEHALHVGVATDDGIEAAGSCENGEVVADAGEEREAFGIEREGLFSDRSVGSW